LSCTEKKSSKFYKEPYFDDVYKAVYIFEIHDKKFDDFINTVK